MADKSFATRPRVCSSVRMDDSAFGLVERSDLIHRTWGVSCDAWELLATADLAVIAESMPPGSSERAHHHERANQFFYVLSGELTVEFEDVTVTAGPRQGVRVPAGLVHKARNEGPHPVEFLAIAGPSNAEDRVNHL